MKSCEVIEHSQQDLLLKLEYILPSLKVQYIEMEQCIAASSAKISIGVQELGPEVEVWEEAEETTYDLDL